MKQYNLICKACGQKFVGTSPTSKHQHGPQFKLHLTEAERKAKYTPFRFRKPDPLNPAPVKYEIKLGVSKPTLEQRVAALEATIKAIKVAL